MIPAVSQGALAIEVREDDIETTALVNKINDVDTRIATDAERAFLRALGGGCNFPIASYATIKDNELTINGLYASNDGTMVEVDSITGHKASPHQLAQQLASHLQERLRQKARKTKEESDA